MTKPKNLFNCLNSCLMATIIVSLLTVNIIFAFFNPDQGGKETISHCYTIQESNSCSLSQITDKYTDTTANFFNLFYWGVGIQLLQLFSLISVVISYHKDNYEVCKTVSLVIFLFSFLAGILCWVIVGSIFRFRDSGEIISSNNGIN